MKAVTYINSTQRFEEYQEGDAMADGPTLVVDGHAPAEGGVERTLDRVYAIGNRMEPDNDGQQWPSNVRSLSVGDVIGLEVFPGTFRYWAVAEFGFEALKGGPQ